MVTFCCCCCCVLWCVVVNNQKNKGCAVFKIKWVLPYKKQLNENNNLTPIKFQPLVVRFISILESLYYT